MVQNCQVYNGNTSTVGGALYVLKSDITFCGYNRFYNNCAVSGGAIYADNSNLMFSNQFEKLNDNVNICDHIYKRVILMYCHQMQESYENTTSHLHSARQAAVLKNNKARKRGGAIMLDVSTMAFNTNIQFIDNNAAQGGGCYSQNNTMFCQARIMFNSNVASFYGGGCTLFQSEMMITKSLKFISNKASRGGGLALMGKTSIKLIPHLNLSFEKNHAFYFGGAIYQNPFNNYVLIVNASLLPILNQPTEFF